MKLEVEESCWVFTGNCIVHQLVRRRLREGGLLRAGGGERVVGGSIIVRPVSIMGKLVIRPIHAGVLLGLFVVAGMLGTGRSRALRAAEFGFVSGVLFCCVELSFIVW